jgi:hypothetical protein
MKHVIEGQMDGNREETGRGNQLLDDVKETSRRWQLQEEALDCTVWKTRCGRCY